MKKVICNNVNNVPSKSTHTSAQKQPKETNIQTFFKPIQNWQKILKLPTGSYTDASWRYVIYFK